MTIATPSAGMVLWMLLLLIPLAALFAAVCLALSVVARSMKEAQYYLTPVYMITLPLVFLSLAPGLKIDLFHSLVPVTGVSLLLRSLLLGEYDLARPYAPVVLVSTCTYALIALQIAVERFKDESVLFRDSERFSPVDWLRHLIRDRGSRPASLHALTCFAIMVALAWFLSVGAAPGVATLIVSQLGFILLPPVVMAWLFTSEPMKTLRLRWPRGVYLLLGPLLAVALNPAIREVALWVEWAFPVPEAVAERLDAFFATIPNAGMMLLVLALLPAICEEVAFRGYILSGLQRGRRTIIAVLISAVLFGFMHVLLSLSQQVVVSLLLGLLLGYLAIRSGSLLPGILFHLTSNGLNVVLGRMAESASEPTVTSWLFRDLASGRYHEVWVLGGLACAALPIYWLVGPASERGGGGQSGEPGAFGTPQVDDSDRELT